MFGRKKKIETKEYLELKKELSALQIDFKNLELNFDLIIKKLKVKYKISKPESEETETQDPRDKVLVRVKG